MSKPGLVLIGAGGHANVCIDVIELHDRFRIAGLVGMPEELHTRILGYTVIATDDGLSRLVAEHPNALITLGQIESPDGRMRLYQKAIGHGFTLPAIISPLAHVSRHASVGAGTIVMHGAVINAGARVGNNCIINTRALIEHNSVVEDHCHVSTGAVLNGDVTIKEGCFVGSGAIMKEGCIAGIRCVIGMGLSVRQNLDDHTRFTGAGK